LHFATTAWRGCCPLPVRITDPSSFAAPRSRGLGGAEVCGAALIVSKSIIHRIGRIYIRKIIKTRSARTKVQEAQ
jgi:hypothetical protein